MNKRVPIEVAGFVNRRVWVRDVVRGVDGFRWYSVINEDHHEVDDYLPWDDESGSEIPPF